MATTDEVRQWTAPFGTFAVGLGQHGVTLVRDGSSSADTSANELMDEDMADAFDEHIHGRASSLRLDLQGLTPLAQMTLGKLLEIPFGEVRPYAWVAREIGRPAAVRPVATAVASNPIPLLIPCHRVVRSDGSLGGFSLGGPDMKQRLLDFEGVDTERLVSLAASGIRYLGDNQDRYHLPTCSIALQLTAPDKLASVEAAQTAGYETCRRCRP